MAEIFSGSVAHIQSPPEQKHHHNHFIHLCLKVSHFNPMSHM